LIFVSFTIQNVFNVEVGILGVVATGSQSTNINVEVSDELRFGLTDYRECLLPLFILFFLFLGFSWLEIVKEKIIIFFEILRTQVI